MGKEDVILAAVCTVQKEDCKSSLMVGRPHTYKACNRGRNTLLVGKSSRLKHDTTCAELSERDIATDDMTYYKLVYYVGEKIRTILRHQTKGGLIARGMTHNTKVQYFTEM